MTFDTSARRYRHASLWLLAAGVTALLLADLSFSSGTPGREMARLLQGFMLPDLTATGSAIPALVTTLAFAFQGIALAVVGGALLALAWHWRPVRVYCAMVRAVHELFWALLFLQFFGLSPLTGVLAIAIPYAGIFAKVFGEILEESDRTPARALPAATGKLSVFLYARLPLIWRACAQYSAYRLECAIRTSAILGFIGLPTLGFHLETAFRQGDYGAGSALLYLLLAVIATQRWWLRRRLLPVYLVAAFAWIPPLPSGDPGQSWTLFTAQLLPTGADGTQGAAAFMVWLWELFQAQGLEALWNTLVLGTASLLGSALLALCLVPLVSRHFGRRSSRIVNHVLLVLMRSTPEFLLAFIFLLLMGPSMLPGILALSLHTGAIIAFLCARFSDRTPLRADAPRGSGLYFWEVLPRLFPNFLALCLYRWEILMRETAILGILGIQTLGFFVDSAFAEFRLDQALALILLGVLLNLAVDGLSRWLRTRLRLNDSLPNMERRP